MNKRIIITMSILGMLFSAETMQGQMKNRDELNVNYTWNLQDLFASEASWQEGKENIKNRISEVDDFKGKLGTSAESLTSCLMTVSDISKELSRLHGYASMHSDQDTRVSHYQGMKQEIQQIYSTFGSASAFIEPEILAMDKSTIDGFIKENKDLKVYAHYLGDILRTQEHTGTAGEEKIIAESGLIAGNNQTIYSIFSNAEFPNPKVTLSDGKEVELNKSNFALSRTSSNREDRALVFDAFFSNLDQFKGTFGAQLSGEVKKNMFYKNVKKYNSSLESALDRSNIPTEVYHGLIDNVNTNLGTFHRYLALRKRILKLDELHYYDLYAPLLDEVSLDFTVEESQQNIEAALVPLGKKYTSVISQAFNERWIDMYPNEGKRSGAYSAGSAYDVHPYILMNYNGKYNDMSTLAHELGHTMQSYLSNKNQPYPLANYSIFVAEVASTFNEALLNDYMLDQIKDDKTRLSILGSWLEGAKGTLFRQTQFAEFELKIHELTEKGEALTGEKFHEIYLDLTRKYYGHDKGICIVDDYIKSEWSYIPHFYFNFYVYQYATSFTASQALSEKVLAGDKATTKSFINFLSSGGSKYPIDLLKETGADMTSSQPFDLTIKKMNKVMDEMETILDRMRM